MKRKTNKEDILEQGIELMYINGYHGTGIKDIADASGILKGSFYNYFDSKEVFCQEALDYYSQKTHAENEEIVAKSNLSPLSKLKTIYKARIEIVDNNSDHLRGCLVGNICQELGDTNKSINETIDNCINRDGILQTELICKAVEMGEINIQLKPKQLADFIMNSWQGALLRIKSSGDLQPLHLFYELIFGQMLKPPRIIE